MDRCSWMCGPKLCPSEHQGPVSQNGVQNELHYDASGLKRDSSNFPSLQMGENWKINVQKIQESNSGTKKKPNNQTLYTSSKNFCKHVTIKASAFLRLRHQQPPRGGAVRGACSCFFSGRSDCLSGPSRPTARRAETLATGLHAGAPMHALNLHRVSIRSRCVWRGQASINTLVGLIHVSAAAVLAARSPQPPAAGGDGLVAAAT